MNKKAILILIVFTILSTLLILYTNNIYDVLVQLNFAEIKPDDYLYGEATGEKGKIALKIKVDNSNTIKEVIVTEHPDSEKAIYALQKLIDNTLDKQYYNEIDTVTGATDTSNTYMSIIKDLLGEPVEYIEDEQDERISIEDPDNRVIIEREVINTDGLKSGIGAYVYNNFQDADYDKNGSLFTSEYICAVMVNEYNNIVDVKFDYIPSNIGFDSFGKVPTGDAKAYTFISERTKKDFNGIINDGNVIDIYRFEDRLLDLKSMDKILEDYGNRRSYAPYLMALQNAIDNSRFIGANEGDKLGMSVSKVLHKRNIKDATNTDDGQVNFSSSYCMMTLNKNNEISSCMFDNTANRVVLTNSGRVLGSREKEVYTLNELANTAKYTRMDKSKFDLKVEYNVLSSFMRGNTIDNMINYVALFTDDRGIAKADDSFRDLKDIDFIEVIDLISRSFADAIKITAK